MIVLALAASLATPGEPVRFERELSGGASAALCVEDRGARLDVWLEAEIGTRGAPASLEGWIGSWAVGDGTVELDGDELGELLLEPVGPGREEGRTLYRSPVWTLGLDGLEPVTLRFRWAVLDVRFADGGRFDGLDEDARLVGWTAFELDGLAARATFYEGREGCAVHVRLENGTGADVYLPGNAPRVTSSRYAYRLVVDEDGEVAGGGAGGGRTSTTSCGPATRGPVPVRDADREAWRFTSGSVRRSMLRMRIAPPAAGEGAPPPGLERWSLTAELPAPLPELPTVRPAAWGRHRVTFGWSHTEGIAVSAGK